MQIVSMHVCWSAVIQRKVYKDLRNFAAGPQLWRKLIQIGSKAAVSQGFGVIRYNSVTPPWKDLYVQITGKLSQAALVQVLTSIVHCSRMHKS